MVERIFGKDETKVRFFPGAPHTMNDTTKKVMRVLITGGKMGGKDLFCVNWGPGETREYEGQLYKRNPSDGFGPPEAYYIGDDCPVGDDDVSNSSVE